MTDDTGLLQHNAISSVFTGRKTSVNDEETVIRQFDVFSATFRSQTKQNQRQFKFLAFIFFHLLFKTRFPSECLNSDGKLKRENNAVDKTTEKVVLRALHIIVERYATMNDITKIDDDLQKVVRFVVSTVVGGVEVEQNFRDIVKSYTESVEKKHPRHKTPVGTVDSVDSLICNYNKTGKKGSSALIELIMENRKKPKKTRTRFM